MKASSRKVADSVQVQVDSTPSFQVLETTVYFKNISEAISIQFEQINK